MKLPAVSTVCSSMLNAAFNYVILTSKRLNIDESHALKHSMDVLNYANCITESLQYQYPELISQYNVISASAILHDMCDNKYAINTDFEIENIQNLLSEYMEPTQRKAVCDIISTMSYSTVKKTGYPKLNNYQMAYHVVREADLLSGYDINRCIIYGMMKENATYIDAVKRAKQLYDSRTSKYLSDNLFITTYSINKAHELDKNAAQDINLIYSMIV